MIVLTGEQTKEVDRLTIEENGVPSLALMENAARMGADLIVYPEAALTAFFPHWSVESEQELDSYFEAAMPNAAEIIMG